MRSQVSVPLSRLMPGKRNPRRVKPSREAHDRLVALIRAHGLLHPLVVRPSDADPARYVVIAGNRRLAALREIHRGAGDPKIPCLLRTLDVGAADALSLGENFGREPMHPQDEAEAFARLARQDGKDAGSIAAEFGVSERYVRQRMKLATLADPVKAAYRQGEIDTGTAEAFATVPADKQVAVWTELGGKPHHAQHVRNVIAEDWIDAERALFDLATLPEGAVSQDLFGERVLVERQAFMTAQAERLESERTALLDDGWKDVVVASRAAVQDRLYAMASLPRTYDPATTKRLAKLARDQTKLEKLARRLKRDDPRLRRLGQRYDRIGRTIQSIESTAPVQYPETAKATGTVFLLLDPDGQVYREYRKPRPASQEAAGRGATGNDAENGTARPPAAPTSADLSDRQRAVTFAHQAVCVREALLEDPSARKRLLALVLHERVRHEAIALRHEANGTTLHADNAGAFGNPAYERVRAERGALDPVPRDAHLPDVEAYELLATLPAKKLDRLIDLLLVSLVTAHPARPTPLVTHLATALGVNVRRQWTPDADWLGAYQKVQVAHLIAELLGPVRAPGPEKKKSELIAQAADLFARAKAGTLADAATADRVNAWLPSTLRPEPAA